MPLVVGKMPCQFRLSNRLDDISTHPTWLLPRLGIGLEDKNNQVIIKSVMKKLLLTKLYYKLLIFFTKFFLPELQSSADLKLAFFYTQPKVP